MPTTLVTLVTLIEDTETYPALGAPVTLPGARAVCDCGWAGDHHPFDEEWPDTTTDRAWADARDQGDEHAVRHGA